MTQLTRRSFGKLLIAGAGTFAMPAVLRAQGKPRVVVIGGGAGGGTAARYLAKDSKGALDVTLIEANKSFTTCFFSNLHLGGYRTLESLTHGYDKIAGEGVKVIHAMAESIDRDKREVKLADGSAVAYDRLVVSPGIDLIWDSVPGYSQEAAETAPHAWKAGPQTTLLKQKLDALTDGQNIVMVAPPNPYRCPPGPYERISMFAHVLKSKGFTKSKIFIIDPKDKFSKQPLFDAGWKKHYPGMVEWLAPTVHGGVKSVDVAAGKVTCDLDSFEGALLNIIPAQKAGAIAHAAGLADAKGFCSIDPESMKSKVDPNIFVIGDASVAGDMPKSGFSANSQAKVAAMTIRAELTGSKVFPAKYANTCWSLIETDDGIKIGAQYEPKDGKITSVSNFLSKADEDAATRKATFEESVGWYAGITADIFG
jgi:NADPH-dependent 2,4-dienoyl-CoA reductase/sulfur reductase-like enzyme